MSLQNWTTVPQTSGCNDGNIPLLNQHCEGKINIDENFESIFVGGFKRFKCRFCSYLSVQKGHMRTHVRKHTGERPFKCDSCSACFYTKCNLTAHQRIHSASKPYKCTKCSYSAAQLSSLSYHMKRHYLFQTLP